MTMTIGTDIQPNDIDQALIKIVRLPESGCIVVRVKVSDKAYNHHTTTIFCHSEVEVDTIMAAMAAAAREHFGNAEPEADWDAIASEMDLDHQMEDARGI